MSDKREIVHVQAHTEYVRSHLACRLCGTSVPAGRGHKELCLDCHASS